MNKRSIQVNLAHPWRAENHEAVVYAVLMREGVRCGSAGCFLWRRSVLSDNPERWNGVPVCLGHPQADGGYVSVNHNETTKRTICGTIRHATYDETKRAITAEIVVNLSDQNLGRLQNLKEVSIGVFSQEKAEAGNYHNKHYDGVTQGYKADHVAILPENEVGACSWNDGCGLRLNISEESKHELLKEFAKAFTVLMKDPIKHLTKMSKEQLDQNNDQENLLLSPCVKKACDQQEQPPVDYTDDQMLMPMEIQLAERKRKKLEYLNQK